MATDIDLPIEKRILRLLYDLGLQKAHFGAREFQEFDGLARFHPEVVASLTLVFPPRTLKADVLQPFGPRLLCFYGTKGPNAPIVKKSFEALPDATQVCFENYLDVNWSDVAADHTEAIADAMLQFLGRMTRIVELPPANLLQREGEIAGITYRVMGSGPPLMLLPLVLAPSQWEPLLSRLSQNYCTIVLGGAELGGVRQLEARGRTESYQRALKTFVAEMEIKPGENILEVGCGSGVLTRLLVKCTQRVNPIIAVDINRYFLREATALAKMLGCSDAIEFREGSVEALPFADNHFDITISATVMEEVDADQMLAELIRVTKPGGRIGVMIRAEDMMSFVNLSLRPDLKTKVETPRGNVSEGGCADVALYRRFHEAGLVSLKMFPQLVPFRPTEPHGKRVAAGILATLNESEADEWRAVTQTPEASELLFIAKPFHCAVGTKPI
ncbi:MAG TPA: methyltransferase domain-containing protein [Candidatus Binatia bacterium]|nr:methyltransferase domain-containing protein [Candidatus Binatia bacterium]